jgi:hypothetical protein
VYDICFLVARSHGRGERTFVNVWREGGRGRSGNYSFGLWHRSCSCCAADISCLRVTAGQCPRSCILARDMKRTEEEFFLDPAPIFRPPVTQVFAKDPCRLAHFLFSSLFHQCEATSAITKN